MKNQIFRNFFSLIVFCALHSGEGFTALAQAPAGLNRAQKFAEAQQSLQEFTLEQQDSIERFLSLVGSWYRHPDARERPRVIGLWGPTGTGKTSSVSKALEVLGLKPTSVFIDLQEFAENESSHGGSLFGYDYASASGSILNRIVQSWQSDDEIEFDIETDGFEIEVSSKGDRRLPGIKVPADAVVLLDEFQYASTVNRLGEKVNRQRIQPLWEVLGNGGIVRTPNPRVKFWKEMLDDFNYKIELTHPDEEGELSESDQKKIDEKRKNIEKRIREWIQKKIKAEPAEIELDFSKTLFVVTGNLDDLFPGASDMGREAERADEYYEQSRQISPQDLQMNLGRHFTPKDLARLGSNHILFLPFSKAGFQRIIQSEVDKVSSKLREKGVELLIDPSVLERFFAEAVIPSQGYRPILNGRLVFFDDPLGELMILLKDEVTSAEGETLDVRKQRKIEVSLSDDQRQLVWKHSGKEILRSWIPTVSVDRLTPYPQPVNERVAFYMAARTAVYLALAKTLPLAVFAKSDFGVGGSFRVQHRKPELRQAMTYQEVLNELAILVAGFAAENLVFGERAHSGEASVLSSRDMESAGDLAVWVAGHFHFSDSLVHADSERRPLEPAANEILSEAIDRAHEILFREQKFIREVANRLSDFPYLSRNDFLHLIQEHWSKKDFAPPGLDQSLNSSSTSPSMPATDCSAKLGGFLLGNKPLPEPKPFGFGANRQSSQ